MKNNLALLRLASLLCGAMASWSAPAQAQQINYQGRLTDVNGNSLQDGQYTLTFHLYSAAVGPGAVWGPFVCDGNAGTGHAPKADLVNGRFNVILGPSDTAGKSLTDAFSSPGGGPQYLGIRVQDSEEITPRQQFLATPEAIHAAVADTVVAGGIGTLQLADGSVTASKLAGGTGVWLGSGANVYREGGHVGIGTATPNAPLSFANVAGDKISLFANPGASESWGLGLQAGLLQIHSDNPGGDIAFGYGSSAALNETMRIKGDGNVGIGTSTPGAKLHVAGGIRITPPTADTPVGYGLVDIAGNERAQFAIPAVPGQYATDAAAGDTVIRATSGRLLLGTGSGLSSISISEGNVGIGTAPNATLARLTVGTIPVRGGLAAPIGYLTPNGALGSLGDNFANAVSSIAAAGQIIAPVFVASSDARIKTIEGLSDRAADLQTLLGIKITDYHYKDTIGKGSAPHKKVIAQQVETIFPQAVSKHTEVVPDVYKVAACKDGWVALATSLQKGDRVKLVTDNADGIFEVLEVTRDQFRTDFKPEADKVFVFGREVNDFRTVDYDAIAMLNVSATQELAKRMEKLEKRETHLAELEQKAARLATVEQELAELKRAVVQLSAASRGAHVRAVPAPGHAASVAVPAGFATVQRAR